MEIFVFGRFHARSGEEAAVVDAIRDLVEPTSKEPGCSSIYACRSARDPRLFYVHARWKDQAALDRHSELPHTMRFLERVAPLIDHALDVTRAERIAP